jgi:rubrerythrin
VIPAETPSEHGTLDVAAVDRDGAVREAAAALTGRGELLGGALAALGALAAGLAFPGAASAKLSSRDRSVLVYALSLEYLQDAFYTEAERLGALTGPVADAARHLGQVERAHVRAFRRLLGSRAPERPRFDFRGTTEDELAFLRTAVALEELCVGAYAGQVTRIHSPEVLQAAVDIHSVEARHAAWLRHLLDVRPTLTSFDEPRGRRSVVGTVSAKGFIVTGSQAPTTHQRRASPRFTG